MPMGRVKWFDHRTGFGFLVDDTGNEIFVHYTVIDGNGFRRLRDGESVRYELMRGPKGLCASRVYRPQGRKAEQVPEDISSVTHRTRQQS
jgi:CspA family cold shock protein